MELYLQVFKFIWNVGGVEVYSHQSGPHPYVKLSSHPPNSVIHREEWDGLESHESVYVKALMFMVRGWCISRNQRTGYMIQRRVMQELNDDERRIYAALTSLEGQNMRAITLTPTVQWYPTFNKVLPTSRIILEAAYVSLADDPVLTSMFASSDRVDLSEFKASVLATYDLNTISYPRPDQKVPSLCYQAMRSFLRANPNHDPLFIIRHSFVSGGSLEGLSEAVCKMSRDNVKCGESSRRILVGLLRMLAQQRASVKTIPLRLTDENIARLPLESSRSGGINPHCEMAHVEMDDIVIQYCSQFDKRQGGPATRISFLETLEKVRKKIKDTPHLYYDRKIFDPIRVVEKMSIKAESRPPLSDKYKSRIIFIVSLFQMLSDNAVLRAVMERTYGIGANSIGHKWWGGGAQRLAERMGAFDDPGDRAYMSLDISKFDQSVLAGVIIVVMLMPFLLYDHDVDYWPEIEYFFLFAVEGMAAKIVKWFGDEWKIIWGIIFSGKLLTSAIDSWYLELVFHCFDMYMYHKVGDKPYYRAAYKRFKDYGDDGMYGIKATILRFICWDKHATHPAPEQATRSPHMLRHYLYKYWHMDLKMEETYCCFPDDPRPDMSLSCFFTQLGNPYRGYIQEIAYRGPKFLKRYLIKRLGVVMPFRPTVDYISKATCIAGDNHDIALHLIRLRALAMDTMGTNTRAYLFLRRAHDHLVSRFTSGGQRALDALVNSKLIAIRDNDSTDSTEDRNLIERIGGKDAAVELLWVFPDQVDILQKAFPDRDLDDRIRRNFEDRKYFSPEKLIWDTHLDL